MAAVMTTRLLSQKMARRVLLYTFPGTGPTTSALTVNDIVGGTADAADDTGATPGAGKTIKLAAGFPTALVTIDPTLNTTLKVSDTVALMLAADTG